LRARLKGGKTPKKKSAKVSRGKNATSRLLFLRGEMQGGECRRLRTDLKRAYRKRDVIESHEGRGFFGRAVFEKTHGRGALRKEHR